jgi:hypothetical protein
MKNTDGRDVPQEELGPVDIVEEHFDPEPLVVLKDRF